MNKPQQNHGNKCTELFITCLTLLVSIVDTAVLACWQKNGNRLVSCLKWSHVTTYTCAASCSTRTLPELTLIPDPLAFVPAAVVSLWQVFHFFLCQNADSMNAVIFIIHNKCAVAITAQLQIGTDPAYTIADGNLLKIKQGREILNMF